MPYLPVSCIVLFLLLPLASAFVLYQKTMSGAPTFSESERAIILSHGPWPSVSQTDSSNRLSTNAQAIDFGKQLFFDAGLSQSKSFACVSCHIPEQHFTDNLPTAQGRVPLERNTPSIFNLANQRWFGWGGESDSLWAHSIIPLLSKKEMATSAQSLQEYLSNHSTYSTSYQQLFKTSPDAQTSEAVLVNIAKVLAAYQETLTTPRTAFDDFRDALANNSKTTTTYSASAQRGLKLFIGKGNCNLCHSGALFTNGEFGDVGVPFFTPQGVDGGRYNGIKTVKKTPYNRLGQYSDEKNEQTLSSVTHIRLQHKNWGEFKVPSLRGIKNTAPYMHNGSLKNLIDVINHYSTVNPERLHSDGESIIKPLQLNDLESNDLLNFLNSL